MKIILLQRVEKLGQMGQLVDVKPGYARNYLLPTKRALRATKSNIAAFETQRVKLEGDNLKRAEDARYVSNSMTGVRVVLIRQASESGHLYGSVRPKDITDCLLEKGFVVAKTQVHIKTPIKTLGLHEVSVILHPEVITPIQVHVAQSEEEARAQNIPQSSEEAQA